MISSVEVDHERTLHTSHDFGHGWDPGPFNAQGPLPLH